MKGWRPYYCPINHFVSIHQAVGMKTHQVTSSIKSHETCTIATSIPIELPLVEQRPGEAPIQKVYLKPKSAPKDISNEASGTNNVNTVRIECNQGQKKRGGTFKKRPIDAEPDPADMLCRPVASGESCQFGDKCKFNHDINDYMKRKPKDLGDRCPVFDARGYCRYGVACRFANAHIEKVNDDYHNVKREDYVEALDHDVGDEVNDLNHDLRMKLRKGTYDFQSKQQMKKAKKNGGKCQQCNDQTKEVKTQGDTSSVTLAEATATSETLAARNLLLASEPMQLELAEDVKIESDVQHMEMEPAEVMKIESDVQYMKTEPADDSPLLAERKPIDFKRKIYIAPLTTVGNLPFRRLLKQTGADITCGEMAMATNLLKAQQSEWALLRRHKSEDIFGVQLAGSFSDQMARACELLARETDIDFVDINMGCPIDIVCRSGAGSALMTRPPRLLEVVSGALTGLELGTRMRTGGTVNTPGLTVKLRTGWSEKQPSAHKLVPKLLSVRASLAYVNAAVVTADFKLRASQSIDAITVHGRSRLQRYTKNADWDYIFQCSDARTSSMNDTHSPPVPFIGGGDVLSYEEFDDHLQNGKLDTCMLARGALIKPWLPTEIKERRHWDISASERFDLLKDFVCFGLEHWGSDQKGVNRTRRYLLEWQSFLCRYIPVGLLETLPQRINDRPSPYYGRNDLETLMASDQAIDWVKISEMLLGPVPANFQFVPKHRANAYETDG
ncbi:unnamed protein product [Peronospora belbahrii]|uniref:tRNA-dihydrouridine(47) synthase [NAD(P)(+)] n=1 Tax=Peronospora belbahrii TaxID=622444 RepID=A0AAU9L8H1_9STRA|nr:unnamed protein product [Peronospora belbahrii]CAH0522269.1 unnamed protein product [Peronospora belbahrii]